MTSAPALHDIQGLFARGYGTLPAARFMVLGFGQSQGTRAWLSNLVPQLTRSDERPERRAVHIAFTAKGLEKLGVEGTTVSSFSNEFVEGMATQHRSRILADVGPSAPESWDWGGPTTPEVHAILLLYARDEHELGQLESDLGLDPGMSVITRLETSDLQGREPFGFRDGISQPIIEGLPKKGSPETTLRCGEFILGYPNEYGRYTDTPLLERGADPTGILPIDPATRRPDLGRNGTYLVFRQLSQDVAGFWRFLDALSRGPDGGPRPERRMQLAAKMVGRWPSGAPLALAPEADDQSLQAANDFGYHDLDPLGDRCPIGAHIRRSNPRDSLDPAPGTEKSYAINRRHRILRRGREYGTPLTPEEALDSTDDRTGDERGLHFMCLNGNIARQFEFVSGTWLNDPKFAGLYDDADPLVGPSRPYGGTFTIPAKPFRERILDVPRFVTVKGGAYLFMPGIAATKYLANLRV